jgi:hypothetical protein
MAHLLAGCPNLINLRIPVNVLEFDYRVEQPHLTLTRVSVSLDIYGEQSPSSGLYCFKGCMAALFAMRRPQLRTVQVVDFDNETLREQPDFIRIFKDWIDKWLKEGVELEDGSGTLLSDRPPFTE